MSRGGEKGGKKRVSCRASVRIKDSPPGAGRKKGRAYRRRVGERHGKEREGISYRMEKGQMVESGNPSLEG